MAKRKRVWNVEIVQQEMGDWPINRGRRGMSTRTEAEQWLKRELEYRSKPDKYGNFPYGGDGKGGPVQIVSTRIYAAWPDPEPPIYILDY